MCQNIYSSRIITRDKVEKKHMYDSRNAMLQFVAANVISWKYVQYVSGRAVECVFVWQLSPSYCSLLPAR